MCNVVANTMINRKRSCSQFPIGQYTSSVLPNSLAPFFVQIPAATFTGHVGIRQIGLISLFPQQYNENNGPYIIESVEDQL